MTLSPEHVALTSGGDEIRTRAYVNHRIYAAEAGFDYRLEIGLCEGAQTPYHYKFAVIEHVVPRYSWTVWLDDDVYFTDWETKRLKALIQAAEDAGDWCVVAEGPVEPQGVWSAINTGVMALRNDARTTAMLERARHADLAEVAKSWRSDDWGLFTRGDQDAIWWSIVSDEELRDGCRIVKHTELNSRPHLIICNPNEVQAVHFCGPGDKRARVARFGRQFGMGQELVPSWLLEKYGIRRREVLADPELMWREGRDSAGVLRQRVRRKVNWVRSTRSWS